MNKIINFFKTYKENHQNLSSGRVAFLGVYLGIMIAMKYLLGFVPGIEIITYMFIIAGIFLPLIDGLLLVVSFNLLIMVLYGWGTWQLMYWPLWITDLVGSKIISKFTKNKYVFASWGFLCGFSVAFWYFLSDMLFFDRTYATTNIITAIPINLIEGFTTVIMILTTAGPLSKVFAFNSYRLWGIDTPFAFSKVKKPKLALILTTLINIIMVVAIVLLFLYNQYFLDWKETAIGHRPATKI